MVTNPTDLEFGGDGVEAALHGHEQRQRGERAGPHAARGVPQGLDAGRLQLRQHGLELVRHLAQQRLDRAQDRSL